MEATHPNESCGYPKPKQKRTKFEGTEKMLRDALLTGIAAKFNNSPNSFWSIKPDLSQSSGTSQQYHCGCIPQYLHETFE
jgi:hypothetical protein